MKDVYSLAHHQPPQTRELLYRVHVVKTGERELGHLREARFNLLVEGSFVAEHGEAHVVALSVEPLEKLDSLSLGSANLEAGDQMKHARPFV